MIYRWMILIKEKIGISLECDYFLHKLILEMYIYSRSGREERSSMCITSLSSGQKWTETRSG